jgi:malonate-semialdehyde dehydrogenase (acetylating) / methylmalonate-semialdehyde dehydrogenase
VASGVSEGATLVVDGRDGPVPVVYYSFGGWRNSLFGATHAHGMDGVHFFTRDKVVTFRWLDPSHGGLNLGFPQND